MAGYPPQQTYPQQAPPGYPQQHASPGGYPQQHAAPGAYPQPQQMYYPAFAAMNKTIGVDLSQPRTQTEDRSDLSRTQNNTTCCWFCCPTRTYHYSDTTESRHDAQYTESSCLARTLGCIACKPYESTVRFTGAGRNFESKKTISCMRYHVCDLLLCPVGAICGTVCSLVGSPCPGDDPCDKSCPCCRTFCKTHELKVIEQGATDGVVVGNFKEDNCWSSCLQLCFPCNAYPIYTSYNPSGDKEYVLRDNRMLSIEKLPVTYKNSEDPVAWITITAERATCCNGCLLCSCGHRKSAAIEVNHGNLAKDGADEFKERAKLMALAIKYDEGVFVSRVGCCFNADRVKAH